MRKTRRRSSFKGADLIERARIAEDRVKSLRVNITRSEERVMILLDELDLEYVFQYPVFDEWFFIIADFYLPKYNMIIEVDGESHDNMTSKKKEAKRKRWLAKDGISVLRIKNKATRKLKSHQLIERILRLDAKN